MSAIQDTDYEDEDAEPRYAYMFLVGYGEDGRYVDAMVDATLLVDKTSEGLRASAQLLGMDHELLAPIFKALHATSGLKMRLRFGGQLYGPYLIRSPLVLTRSTLQEVVKSFTKERLEEFKVLF